MTSSRPVGHGPVRAYDWIAHHTRQRPDKEAVRDLGSGRSFTYADLDRRIDAMAAYLASLGIGRGDRVGLLAHNGVEFFDLQFACARRGAICVLLNWRLTVTELEYILNDSSPALIVHDISFAQSAEELQRRCSIGALLAIDGGRATSPYEQVLARFDGEDGGRADLIHDDLITIMYTSGTTGLAKGAMITHGMNFWNAVNLGIPAGIGLDTVHLNVLPLFHTGGLNCYSNPVLHAGGTVVILKAFDPGETLRVLGDPAQGITHFFAVLRIAGVGGAPCALKIMENWFERGVSLMQGGDRTLCRPAGEVQVPSRHRDRRRAAAQRHRQGAQARTRSQFVDADAPKIS